MERKAREEYRKAKIETARAACDLLSDLTRIAVEYHFKLPIRSLGRCYREGEERKIEEEKHKEKEEKS